MFSHGLRLIPSRFSKVQCYHHFLPLLLCLGGLADFAAAEKGCTNGCMLQVLLSSFCKQETCKNQSQSVRFWNSPQSFAIGLLPRLLLRPRLRFHSFPSAGSHMGAASTVSCSNPQKQNSAEVADSLVSDDFAVGDQARVSRQSCVAASNR